MSLNWKRILLLIGFLLSVVAIAYLLYFFFLKPAIPTQVPTNVNVAEPGVLPPAGLNANIPIGANVGVLTPGANVAIPLQPAALPPGTEFPSTFASGGLTEITSLTSERSYGTTLASDGSSLLYYDKNSGQFYRLTNDGKKILLTDKIFHEVENIIWSQDKEKAVLEYPDGSNIVYNFKTKEQITLPKHWKDFDFSPNSDQLVFKSMGTGEENRWLAVAKTDGSQAEKIELLGDKDATVFPDWSPNNQVIATFVEDKNADQQTLYFVGLNDENFKSTIIEGRNFQGLWSTKGDRLLYSAYSGLTDFKPSLWIVSAQGENIGQNRQSLDLETWASKCSFSNNETVYCAVPKNLEEGAGIFYRELDNSPTDIYKIDLKTGFKSMIAAPVGNHNIESIMASNDGSYLYFTSKNDGRIYQVRLK